MNITPNTATRIWRDPVSPIAAELRADWEASESDSTFPEFLNDPVECDQELVAEYVGNRWPRLIG